MAEVRNEARNEARTFSKEEITLSVEDIRKAVRGMAITYNAQTDHKSGTYSIQFETNNYEYFEMVEKACRAAVYKSDKERDKNRAEIMKALGHL